MASGRPRSIPAPFTAAQLRDMRSAGDTVQSIHSRARIRQPDLKIADVREILFGAAY